MRDELEIVRSLGASDRSEEMRGFAAAQAALRRELDRERSEADRLNGPGGAAIADGRESGLRGARGRGKRRRWALGLLIPAAIVAGGATYALTRSSVDYAAGFGCYDRLSLEADVAVPGGDASNPVTACAAVWRAGALGPPSSHAVPPQTACVLPSGAVGVFPSGDPRTCARLGLERLPADYGRTAAVVGELASTLRRVVDATGQRCLNSRQATVVVSRELTALRLPGWHVRPQGPFASRDRCAATQVGQWQRTVFVFSEPRPAPPPSPAQRALGST